MQDNLLERSNHIVMEGSIKLSAFFLQPIHWITMNIDIIMAVLLGAYAALCALFYNPNLPIPTAIHDYLAKSMLFLRAQLTLDSVHFVGGSDSLENSWSIIQPILNKLTDLNEFDLGGVLIKISVVRSLLRVAGFDSHIARLRSSIQVLKPTCVFLSSVIRTGKLGSESPAPSFDSVLIPSFPK